MRGATPAANAAINGAFRVHGRPPFHYFWVWPGEMLDARESSGRVSGNRWSPGPSWWGYSTLMRQSRARCAHSSLSSKGR